MRRRGLAFLMTATMMFSMLMGVPAASMKVDAATDSVIVGDFTVSGESLGSSDYSYDETNGILTIKSSKTMTITNATKTNRTSIFIAKDISANLVLKGVDMSLAYVPGKVGIEIADDSTGNVTLLLDGENSIITRNASAIQKNGSNGTLTIDEYDSGSNQLYAYTSMKDVQQCGATIGSEENYDCSNITISGGKVYVAASSSAAAIGGGTNGDGNNIKITDGIVYACGTNLITSGSVNGGAAIGGGYCGNGNNITISGGEVHANFIENGERSDDSFLATKIKPSSGYYVAGGAAIGGGQYGDGNNITISGGVVTAEGGTSSSFSSAGIGAGGAGSASNIKITGGQITSVGAGEDGAGIGTGSKESDDTGDVVDITISGGTIKATGGTRAPGIGAGTRASAKVIITGGSINAIPGTTTYTFSGYTGKADAIGLGAYSNGCSARNNYDCYVVSSIDEIVEGDDTVTLFEKTFKGTANANMAGKLAFTYSDGTEYPYNTTGMVADADGYIYAYVKDGVSISEKISDGDLVVLFNGAAKKDWYAGTVTVAADGYTVSSDGNTYKTTCDITTSGTYTLYFKGASGKVTEMSVGINIDTTPPTGKMQLDSKVVSESINEDVTVKKVKLTTPTVYINQLSDANGSGIASVEYAVASKCYATVDAIKKATSLSWTKGNASSYTSVPLTEGVNQTVYARITDEVGNVTYMSTPIYCYDKTGPIIEEYTLSGATATSLDYNITFSEPCEYVFVLLESGTASSWSAIENYIAAGNPGGTLTGNTATQATGTINNLKPNTSYRMFVMARDMVEDISGKALNNYSYMANSDYVKTLKKTKTVSDQVEYIKLGGDTTFTYDLPEILGLDVADMGTVTYSCSKGDGSILATNPTIDSNGKMTVQLNSGLTTIGSQDITITIKSTYYYDISVMFTIEMTDKTTLTLSGVSVTGDSTYDGTEKNYSGTVKWLASNGEDCTSKVSTDVRYIGVDNNYSSTDAPTDAGSYKVVFTVNENDTYKGSKTYPFTINPYDITDEMSDMAWYLDGNTKLSSNTLNITEDGKEHKVSLAGYSSKVTIKSSGTFSAKDVGSYSATVEFECSDNYYLPNYMKSTTLNWNIVAAETDDDDNTSGENGGSTEGGDGENTGDDNENSGEGDNETDDSNNDGSNTGDNSGTTGGDNGEISDGSNSDTTTKVPSVGTTEEVGTNKYKVTTSSTSGGTVEYTAPVNKSSATKVVIPATIVIDGNTYKVTSIAKDAFSGCKKLTSVTIPNGITSIGANAFKKCTSLKTVKIPNSVISIGSNAFNGCKKLTKVTIGTGVKTIGNGAFSGCSKLKTVSINANCKLTKIGDKAFYKCTSLSKITLPKNLTTIGKQAFFGCKKLKTITIKSKKLKKVGAKAIKGINKKATIKCPSKSYVKKYKKLFKSKTGFAKTMKIK